jgi:hypothetical protein
MLVPTGASIATVRDQLELVVYGDTGKEPQGLNAHTYMAIRAATEDTGHF